MIKMQEDFFNKIFTSHFIARVRKGLLKVCVWEGAGDRTELKYFDPNIWPSRCVFLVLLMLNRSPGVHSAGCWLSLLHLISIFSGPQFIRAPSPFGLVWLSLPHLASTGTQTQLYCLLFNSSALYYLQTPTRRYGHASTPPQFLPISGDRDVSLPLSLEWPVWSSSSGNNCHAVHRSLSSGASVYECTMGIFLARPISLANFRPRNFLS